MRKFNFRLEKVRETYDIREQLSKRRFAEAAAAREREQLRLDEIQAEIDQTQADQLEQAQKTFDVTEALMAHRFSLRLQYSANTQEKLVKKSELVVEERRVELTKAMQRKQILDSFRERKLAEHRQEQARLEQNELDDRAAHHVKEAL